ncbi:MAG: thioredoxin family protein, partial [Acidihalobacter sp.]
MKSIKVLGSGCANCKRTLELIESTAKAKGVDIELGKV